MGGAVPAPLCSSPVMTIVVAWWSRIVPAVTGWLWLVTATHPDMAALARSSQKFVDAVLAATADPLTSTW